MEASRFAPRGAPDRAQLERLVASGVTLSEIGRELDRSISTVRYWLTKWGIDRPRRCVVDAASAPRVVQRQCRRHGSTAFVLEGRGYYRCRRCRGDGVVRWRQRVKKQLVEEAGGRCSLCGYGRCVAALHFHHLDPRTKSFGLSRQGVTRSIAEARAEARKCVLLCANCHAEVEAGEAVAPSSQATVAGTPRGGFEPPWPD